MSKISIVVPIYNVEKYIDRCVDSLLEQNYHNYEVIFVDDGSKDGSIDRVKKKIRNRVNFKIITKENGGLSSARNYGLRFAEGEFVTFVDSDDYLDNNFLEKMIDTIGDANICCCGYQEVTEDEKFIRSVGNNFEKKSDEIIYNNIIEAINFIPNAWGKIYRREIFGKLNYPESMLFEDYAIAYKVFYKEKVRFLEEPLYFYRIRSGSIMRDFNKNIISHKFLILEEINDFLKKNKIKKNYQESYINSYLYHGLFVTSCVIINQNANGALKYINELLQVSDGKIFNISNIMKSRSLPKKVKLYLLILRKAPRLAILLKKTQNRIGGDHG